MCVVIGETEKFLLNISIAGLSINLFRTSFPSLFNTFSIKSICLDFVETTIQSPSCRETIPDMKGWFELSPP